MDDGKKRIIVSVLTIFLVIIVRNDVKAKGNGKFIGRALIQSKNYPQYYLKAESNGELWIRKELIWFNVYSPGNTGASRTISLETSDSRWLVDSTGSMHVLSYDVSKPVTFNYRTTFSLPYAPQTVFSTGYTALESTLTPGWYVRHKSSRLYLDKFKSDNLFREDSAWLLKYSEKGNFTGRAQIQSDDLSFLYNLKVEDQGTVWLRFDSYWFGVYGPGNAGIPGTISFKTDDGRWLFDTEGLMSVLSYSEIRNFHRNTSFFLRKKIQSISSTDYKSIESINSPGWYMRNLNYRLELSPFSNSISFRDAASWLLKYSDTLPKNPSWKKVTGRDQLWRFLYPWGSSSERIVFRSSHNKWLVSENGKDEIKNNRVVIGSWEKFRIVFNDDGTVSIKTWQNEYFSAKSNGKLEADQSSVGSSEKFEMFIYKDEKVALRTFYGKWVTAPSTSALQANKDSLGSREQFRGWKEGSIKSWRAVNLKNSQKKEESNIGKIIGPIFGVIFGFCFFSQCCPTRRQGGGGPSAPRPASAPGPPPVPAGWEKVTSKDKLACFLVEVDGSDNYIALKSHHNKWLCAEDDGVTVKSNRTEMNRWEKFEITLIDGCVALKTWKNKYLSAQADGRLEANRDNLAGWEKFEMYISGQDKAAFRSCHKKWLSAQGDGRMEFNRDNLAALEIFRGIKAAPPPPGWEKVESKSQLGCFLVGVEGSEEDFVALKSHHGKWLCAENDAVTINNNRTEMKRWEKFQIIFQEGFVGLKTWKDKYVTAQENGQLLANRDILANWGKFEMFISGGDKVAFRSVHLKWLSAQADGRMEANRNELKGWEMFRGCKESHELCGWQKVTNKDQLGNLVLQPNIIALKSHHGGWLSAEYDNYYTVSSNRNKVDCWEKFEITFTNGLVSLKTWKGKYFSAQASGKLEANRDGNGGSWEKFEMFILDGEKLAFRSTHLKWLRAKKGEPVNFNGATISEMETFHGWKEGNDEDGAPCRSQSATTLSVEPPSTSSSPSASNLRNSSTPQVSVTPLSYSPVLPLPPVDVPNVPPPPSFPMEAPPSYETVMLDDIRRGQAPSAPALESNPQYEVSLLANTSQLGTVNNEAILVGKKIRLESVNYSGHYMRHRSYQVWLDKFDSSELYDLDSSFIVIPGLSGTGVSLNSVNYPDHFIRHYCGECFIGKSDGSDLFNKDASWIVHPGLADVNGISLESLNYRGEYMRHCNWRVRKNLVDGSELFKKDATWKINVLQ